MRAAGIVDVPNIASTGAPRRCPVLLLHQEKLAPIAPATVPSSSAGDLALLNLGELFPAFPSQMPTTSEGGAPSRSQQVRREQALLLLWGSALATETVHALVTAAPGLGHVLQPHAPFTPHPHATPHPTRWVTACL